MEITEFEIRLWCRNEVIEAYVEQVVAAIEARGFKLTRAHTPRRCRPPREGESRIFLIFGVQEDIDNGQ